MHSRHAGLYSSQIIIAKIPLSGFFALPLILFLGGVKSFCQLLADSGLRGLGSGERKAGAARASLASFFGR